MGFSNVDILILIILLSTAVYLYLNRRRRLPLPPSPPQRLISGNYHQFPKTQPFFTYTKWAKRYGPIFHLRIFSKYFLVLNSGKTALDLLESRSTIYSDRPESVFIEKVLKRVSVFSAHFNDPKFRSHRKMMHAGLGPKAVEGYKPLLMQETNVLLQGLKDSPEDFISHLRRNAGSLTLKVTYGYEVESNNDNLLEVVEKAFAINAKYLRPFPVEFFPFLRFLPSWFPFTEFKRAAKELIQNQTESIPFEWSQIRIKSGKYVESFVSRFLLPEDGSIPDEDALDMLKWVAVALYLGGSDTTVAVMTSLFYLMEMYPEVQTRAQEEIDSVTGGERLPTFEDEERMPYIVALIKEVLRWAPVVPLGLQHRLMEDDVYEGYFLPGGSIVVANIWAITHDPELYPNPDVFNPERYLGPNPQTDPFKFVFGFGRRVCPGKYLAERSLFLNVANVLAAFKMEKEVKEGKEVDPEKVFQGGLTYHLAPFPCKISVRAPGLLPSL